MYHVENIDSRSSLSAYGTHWSFCGKGSCNRNDFQMPEPDGIQRTCFDRMVIAFQTGAKMNSGGRLIRGMSKRSCRCVDWFRENPSVVPGVKLQEEHGDDEELAGGGFGQVQVCRGDWELHCPRALSRDGQADVCQFGES